jgi:hypothetical protein
MATRDTPNWLTLSLAPLGSGSTAVLSATLGHYAGLKPYAIIAILVGTAILGTITTVAVTKIKTRSVDIRESSKADVRASAIKGDITPAMAAVLLSDGAARSTDVTPLARSNGRSRFKLPWRA